MANVVTLQSGYTRYLNVLGPDTNLSIASNTLEFNNYAGNSTVLPDNALAVANGWPNNPGDIYGYLNCTRTNWSFGINTQLAQLSYTGSNIMSLRYPHVDGVFFASGVYSLGILASKTSTGNIQRLRIRILGVGLDINSGLFEVGTSENEYKWTFTLPNNVGGIRILIDFFNNSGGNPNNGSQVRLRNFQINKSVALRPYLPNQTGTNNVSSNITSISTTSFLPNSNNVFANTGYPQIKTFEIENLNQFIPAVDTSRLGNITSAKIKGTITGTQNPFLFLSGQERGINFYFLSVQFAVVVTDNNQYQGTWLLDEETPEFVQLEGTDIVTTQGTVQGAFGYKTIDWIETVPGLGYVPINEPKVTTGKPQSFEINFKGRRGVKGAASIQSIQDISQLFKFNHYVAISFVSGVFLQPTAYGQSPLLDEILDVFADDFETTGAQSIQVSPITQPNGTIVTIPSLDNGVTLSCSLSITGQSTS